MKDLTHLTKSDILNIFRDTPDDSWCAFERDDERGHHCAFGQLDEYMKKSMRVSHSLICLFDLPRWLNGRQMAAINNVGNPVQDNIYVITPNFSLESKDIKDRVIAWIEGLPE